MANWGLPPPLQNPVVKGVVVYEQLDLLRKYYAQEMFKQNISKKRALAQNLIVPTVSPGFPAGLSWSGKPADSAHRECYLWLCPKIVCAQRCVLTPDQGIDGIVRCQSWCILTKA